MFDRLSLLSADPILGLIGQYAVDSNPNKIDLGVGVYRDAQGHTPILATVKKPNLFCGKPNKLNLTLALPATNNLTAWCLSLF